MAEDRMLSDEILLGLINKNSGGGGGTTDYDDLSNKPQIAGNTLSGNKSLADLGIAGASEVVKDVKVDGQSCVDANRNAIVQITVPTEYEYTVSKVDNLTLKVTTKQNGDVTDETNYTLSGWSAPVNIDDHIQLDYSTSGGTWTVETLAASTDYPAGQTWTWVYNQTPSVPILTFEEAENHIGLSAAYADLKEHKQDTLTFDNVPTANSNNPVKSGGVFTVLAGKVNTENGKGLSTNDYSDAEKAQVATNKTDISTLKSGLTDLSDHIDGDATTYPYADVITINDAVPANLADCKVKIEPVQDLHGYDKPWVGGGGVNLMPQCVAGTYTSTNCTAVVSADGTITISGTSGGSSENIIIDIDGEQTMPNQTIYAHIFNSTVSGGVSVNFDNPDGTSGVYAAVTSVNKITEFSSGIQGMTVGRLRIWVAANTTISGTLRPMLCTNGNVIPWQPYTNICPIIGHTEAVVTRDGINLFNKNDVTAEYIKSDGQIYNGGADFKLSNYIRINGTFTISGHRQGNYEAGLCFYDEYKNYISGQKYMQDSPATINPPSNAVYTRISFWTSEIDNNQVELGSTATTYEPYAGQQYTLALGDTIYGGTVDFDSGVMTVTKVCIDLGSKTYLYNNGRFECTSVLGAKRPVSASERASIVSDIYQFISSGDADYGAFISAQTAPYELYIYNKDYTDASAFTSAMSGHQLCYELATPFTVQLTPTQIQLLQGTNTLYASTGQISVTVNGVSGAIGAVQTAVNELTENKVGFVKIAQPIKTLTDATESYTVPSDCYMNAFLKSSTGYTAYIKVDDTEIISASNSTNPDGMYITLPVKKGSVVTMREGADYSYRILFYEIA